MPREPLSPARLVAFDRCPRLLWLMKFRPGAAGEDGDVTGRRAVALAVRTEAQRQVPGVIAIDPDLDTTAALAATRAALKTARAISGAWFAHDGVQACIDLLEPEGDGWRIVAVRSTTKAKPEHLAPLATQRWVVTGNGFRVVSARIRHVDRSFALDASGERTGLFADVDVTEQLAPHVAEHPARVAAARATLAGDEPPLVTGEHCRTPNPCAFADHCHKGLPPEPLWPVTVLPRSAGKPFARRGINDLMLVPAEALRSDVDMRVHRATVTGQVEHNPAGAAAAMAGWSYPRIWLDFETVSDAMPNWAGCTPYEQVPFQFIADVEAADGTVVRREFLSLDGTDPRRTCAEALAALPAEGAAIAWHARFERDVVLRLAHVFPDLADRLHNLAARIVDLLPVARDHWYHRDQRGSWSIKAVLPTIAPQLNYADLEVKDGGKAVEAYREATRGDCTPSRRMALDHALRVYCGRDVEAMRVIARRLVVGARSQPTLPVSLGSG